VIEETINGPWGTNAIPGGIRINLQPQPEHFVLIPFTGDALVDLVKQIAETGLTNEQKRKLMPFFAGGLELPDAGPGGGFTPGPQG
jgi:hypothetical protein